MEVDTFCERHAVAVPWHAQKVIVRSDLAGEAQDSEWIQTRSCYLGTERTATNSVVPSLPVPQGRRGFRHALRVKNTLTRPMAPSGGWVGL